MKRQRVRLFLRLTPDVNDRLRTLMRYHGGLSSYVNDALMTLDLVDIDLKAATVRQHCRAITVIVSRSANARVRAAAQQRGCTITALANSALHKWLGEKHA